MTILSRMSGSDRFPSCSHRCRKNSPFLIPVRKFPDWPPVDYPVPDQVIQYVRDLMALNIEEADAILLQSMIAHGRSSEPALLSPPASRIKQSERLIGGVETVREAEGAG